MKINYNIDHKHFKEEVFNDKMSSQLRAAVTVTYGCIYHFTKQTGKCEFYMNQMAQDWGIDRRFFSKAVTILVAHELIEEVVPYQRKTQKPGVYIAPKALKSRYMGSTKQVHGEHKAGTPRATVNNSQRIIKGGNHKGSSPFNQNNDSPHSTDQVAPRNWIYTDEYKPKNKEKE